MGLLDKFFGKKPEGNAQATQVVEDTLDGIFGRAGFDLSYDLRADEEGHIHVEIFGNDQDGLIDREGQLLDAFQLYLKRVLQHHMPEDKINIYCDSNGFREAANAELLQLADKLRGIAIEKNKSVYFRALAPKDRKVIHQYLAEDGRVKSKSVGEGHFKKIKIFPAKMEKGERGDDDGERQPRDNRGGEGRGSRGGRHGRGDRHDTKRSDA